MRRGLVEIPKLCRAYTERLLNFVTESDWADQRIREYAARYGVEAMTSREPIEVDRRRHGLC